MNLEELRHLVEARTRRHSYPGWHEFTVAMDQHAEALLDVMEAANQLALIKTKPHWKSLDPVFKALVIGLTDDVCSAIAKLEAIK